MMKILKYGNELAKTVLIQPVDENDLKGIEEELAYINDKYNGDYLLLAFIINKWNDELSPWKAMGAFKGQDFGSGANDTLNEILKYCNDNNKKYYIGGYSLAALFALWASYKTDVFSGVACASPSMWFSSFIDYMKDNKIKCNNVYLSIGDKESQTGNRVLKLLCEKTNEGYRILKDNNVNCILEINEGNHFKDTAIRTAKAFVWVLNNSQ